jgi:uncharacterized protein (TIGR01244 family)
MAISNLFTQFNRLARIQLIALIVLLFSGVTSVWAIDASEKMSALGLTNLNAPTASIFSSGQPEQDAFAGISQAGVQVVVNLRPQDEQEWNEQEIVESLGMRYINLPVAGAAGITIDNAQKLEAILAELEGKQVLVHCSSGNRVGALRALISFQHNGSDINAAIDDGKQWGLTKLEPLVRGKLGQ